VQKAVAERHAIVAANINRETPELISGRFLIMFRMETQSEP
jgi:hypothetical protein